MRATELVFDSLKEEMDSLHWPGFNSKTSGPCSGPTQYLYCSERAKFNCRIKLVAAEIVSEPWPLNDLTLTQK